MAFLGSTDTRLYLCLFSSGTPRYLPGRCTGVLTRIQYRSSVAPVDFVRGVFLESIILSDSFLQVVFASWCLSFFQDVGRGAQVELRKTSVQRARVTLCDLLPFPRVFQPLVITRGVISTTMNYVRSSNLVKYSQVVYRGT